MTGTEIKAAVYNLTGDRDWVATSTASDALIKNWMQMVVEEFPSEVIECNVETLNMVIAGDTYELPLDFSAGAYYGYYEGDTFIKREISELEFTADGMVIYPIDIDLGGLYYYPIPVFEDITDDIPINRIFQTGLIYFFYAQYYYQSGEGDYEEHKVADMYMGRFERMKNQKLNTFMNKVSDSEPVKTVDALPSRSKGIVRGTDYYE